MLWPLQPLLRLFWNTGIPAGLSSIEVLQVPAIPQSTHDFCRRLQCRSIWGLNKMPQVTNTLLISLLMGLKQSQWAGMVVTSDISGDKLNCNSSAIIHGFNELLHHWPPVPHPPLKVVTIHQWATANSNQQDMEIINQSLSTRHPQPATSLNQQVDDRQPVTITTSHNLGPRSKALLRRPRMFPFVESPLGPRCFRHVARVLQTDAMDSGTFVVFLALFVLNKMKWRQKYHKFGPVVEQNAVLKSYQSVHQAIVAFFPWSNWSGLY